MKPTPQKVNEALEAALTKAFTNLPDLMGDLERGRFQWPSSVIEWVQTETGISPEVNDPVLPQRTDFETALYFLLKERTGQTLESFEAMGTGDFLQLAAVAARIQRHRAAGDRAKTDPPKPTGTWAKQFGVKGLKWEDLSITVGTSGTVIQCNSSPQKVIELWTGSRLEGDTAERRLLELFQELRTLEDQNKVTVSRLRSVLKAVSGIDGDPIVSGGGGTYTRLFEMNVTRGDWGGVSEHSQRARKKRRNSKEEFYGDEFHIESH